MNAPASVEAVAVRHGVPAVALAEALDDDLGGTATLSAGEVEFLAGHGGVPVEVITSPELRRAALVERERASRADWAHVVETALTTAEVVDRFTWSATKVSRLVRSRDLYVVKGVGPRRGNVFPAWQFVEDGVVPGLRHVLLRLPWDWLPVDVEHWMTTANENLPDDVSPLEWLIGGGAPEDASVAFTTDLIAW
ncbi:hypothetical protein IEQ44_07980 [Nocardioides sp. Y6]|uniref:DNA-binding protein n=1 Tax=Nocardioides malaquae TaxID=2773426 RepID=A0ABR9RSS9_9ACTN|nr:hypothetical protein [Nocardioides malaquae]MBE7324588.1 hypothetical protein [Nocardioides malaquae]